MSSWYIENSEERASVRAAALPELDAASEDLQRYFMHQMARIHRLTAKVCDLRQESKQMKAERDALQEALRALAEGGLGDKPWLADYDRIREFARDVLERLA